MAARNGIQIRLASDSARARRYICWSLAALLFPAGALLAAGPNRVEKSFRVEPNCRIRIVNPGGGTVVVRGWDKAEVHAVCLANSPKVEIDSEPTPANGEAERVEFTTHILDSQASPQEKTASYELDVPKDANLTINSSEGSITVDHISGDDSIESIKASVSVSDGAGFIQARSLNGDINLLRPAGHVEATSIMGNITITASESTKVNAQTESGKITFDGEFLSHGDYILKTYAGNLSVTCPAVDSFALEARTLHGKVDNQFQLSRKTHIPYALDGGSAFGSNNLGDATVTLKSFSGAIRVQPR